MFVIYFIIKVEINLLNNVNLTDCFTSTLSLELIDITKAWDSSFVMLCQAFTAADFSCCCLFVGLFAFSFVFSKLNACSIGLNQEIDLAIAEYSTFLPSKTPGLLLLYVLGHRPFVL